MLEAMQKKGAHEPFLDEFLPLLDRMHTPAARLASKRLQETLMQLGSLPPQQAQWIGKDALARLADAAQVALLYALAESDEERYAKLAECYAVHFLAHEPYPGWALEDQALWMPVQTA